MQTIHFPTSPILKMLPPGFQRIHDHTIHVAKFPGIKHDGFDITLIHGIAAAASTWLPLARYLLPHARYFIIPELPGHGLSPAPMPPFSCENAYQILEECLVKNLNPSHSNLIIGNSLGGAFALKFTKDHPDLIKKTVLISPAGAPFPTSAHEIIDLFRPQTLEQAIHSLKKVFAFPTKKAYVLAPALLFTSSQPGFKSLMDSITEIDSNPDATIQSLLFNAQDLSNFHTPALLIWGRRDAILPPQMRDFFDAHLPNSTQRLFPSNFGHCPQFEHTKELACYILDWLNGKLE